MDETQKLLVGIRKNVRIEEIAEFAGVSPMRIRQLENAGVIKSFKDGRTRLYDKWPTLISITKHYMKKAGKFGDFNEQEKLDEKLKAEKLRQAVAKRKLDEIKVQLGYGEVLTSEQVEEAVGPMLTRLRINLLAIPMGVAPLLRDKNDVNDITRILEERLGRALDEVTKYELALLPLRGPKQGPRKAQT